MMRSFLIVALLCAGCSSSADLKVPVELSPMVGSGTVGSFSSTNGFDSEAAYKVSVSKYAGVGEEGYLDVSNGDESIPFGYYYSLGSLDGTLAGSTGVTYRFKDRLGLFAGLSKWESESWGLEYGAHYLMKDFLVEIRKDDSIDDVFYGLGKTIKFSSE